MKQRIIILGSIGMLGQMVKRYFENQNYEVLTFNERFTENNFITYFDKINSYESSIVINCIGKIKQKSNDTLDLIWSNSIFPLEISRRLDTKHFLIQPSTDCVFDGLTQIPYPRTHVHNAKDIYGWSKSLGETAILGRKNSIVIRVSIIGPDNKSDKGLLSWFLNLTAGSKVNGFTDHLWNGITTFEWCKKVESIISKIDFNKKQQSEIFQLGTEKLYSKYEMLMIFQHEFKTKVDITPFDSGTSINRCLNPQIYSPPLEIQIRELNKLIFK